MYFKQFICNTSLVIMYPFLPFTVILYCIFLSFLFANIINGAHRYIVFIAGFHMITSLT